METTIMGFCRVYIGGNIGIMEKKMETTIMGFTGSGFSSSHNRPHPRAYSPPYVSRIPDILGS